MPFWNMFGLIAWTVKRREAATRRPRPHTYAGANSSHGSLAANCISSSSSQSRTCGPQSSSSGSEISMSGSANKKPIRFTSAIDSPVALDTARFNSACVMVLSLSDATANEKASRSRQPLPRSRGQTSPLDCPSDMLRLAVCQTARESVAVRSCSRNPSSSSRWLRRDQEPLHRYMPQLRHFFSDQVLAIWRWVTVHAPGTSDGGVPSRHRDHCRNRTRVWSNNFRPSFRATATPLSTKA